MSNARSIGVKNSLEDSMEVIDFVFGKYESGDKLEVDYTQDKVTKIQASLPYFSMLREKGENISPTVVLTITFDDDDVNKYSVF